MSIKTDILWRVGLIYLAISAFALVVVGKIIYIQFIDDDRWIESAENTRVKDFRIPPHRGDIYAFDMRLLASSVPYYEVRMDLKTPALSNQVFNSGVDSLAFRLSRLFGDRSKAEYKERLTNARRKGNRYLLIKNKVDYIQLRELKTFPIFRLGQFKGGLIINQANVRKKPHLNLASRTIGKTTQSMSGNVVGIEGAFDQYLKGVEGIKRMQKLSGNVWMPLNEAGEIEPRDGSSVVTTIDIDLQDVAEKALLNALTEHNAKAGTAVLMEVKTGDIKAIVNLTDTFGTYMEYYNYAVGFSSEPGSTFKLPALLTAIEDGHVKLTDTIDTENGVFQYYDLTVRDDNYMKGGHGKITVEEVFELSSNVGMAKIITSAYKQQPHRFIDRLYGMNINQPLGISIKGEGDPSILYPGDKMWSGVTLASMSYGYAVNMTPLQILTFYNAIANDGRMVKPRFAKEIRNHGKLERTFPPEVINPSVCSKSTLRAVRKMMEGVVESGTADNLKSSTIKIAGKTGTTQIYNRVTGYRLKSYQASFVGYFPADRPKYSCIVVVYSPQDAHYHGARVAGPVFKDIARKLYATDIAMQAPINLDKQEQFDIPFSKNGFKEEIEEALEELDIKNKSKDQHAEWVATEKTDEYVELKTLNVNESLVPNVVSMGLKDAIFLLENMGLNVEVDGRGSIRKQSLPPGTRAVPGKTIHLEMSFTEG